LSPADPLQEQLLQLQQGVPIYASGAAAFSEAEQATLEALAELIGLTVHSHFLALASLDAAAQLAHDFAALLDLKPAATSTGWRSTPSRSPWS
jgi:hypothetical protein